MSHLPATADEIRLLGWDAPDVIIVTGDAHVDHPSFGAAVIGRVLEKAGYRVAVLAQPDWKNPDSIVALGRPRLFFGVTAGNVDSMLARHTAFKKVRNDDPYTPGGGEGKRPPRSVIAYCNMIRAAFKGMPIVIGGIEASMRRLAHYDFWTDSPRRSIILDSRADLLVYGMGEGAVVEAVRRLDAGRDLSGIAGTVELLRDAPGEAILLPPEEEVLASRDRFLEMYRLVYAHPRARIVQPSGGRFIVQNPPREDAGGALDDIYALPFEREPHPLYGGVSVPAFEMIRCSITSHRGCVSGCSFCSLALHQGRRIVRRSATSILEEIRAVQGKSYFRGHITDIGGPSADMYGYDCTSRWICNRESCLHPDMCPNLIADEDPWMAILGEANSLPGVKHVTVGSGVRFDLVLKGGQSLLRELARRHVSGQLKIAPEHTSPFVLDAMRKRPLADLREFVDAFKAASKSAGRKLHIVPYLMSCHPACGMNEMRSMMNDVRSVFGFVPDQVQAFIPLPMTLSSVMYWTGRDPLTGQEYFIERDPARRRRQHGVFYLDNARRDI